MKLDFFKNLDSRMKRLIYILLGVIVIIIIILIVWKIIVGNNYSTKTIEEKLKYGAISYYKNNKELLPKEDGNEVVIDAEQLITDGYLKDFEKYNKKDGPNCNGQVFVVNNNGHYLYTPNLNCPDYKTTSLSNKIVESSKIVVEGNGLYKIGDDYIYRGEYINNYVSFANQLWRILKIDANGYIKMLQVKNDSLTSYDDRYNVKVDDYYGINNFEISRAKEELNAIYNDEEIFKDEDREKIASKNLCVGKRTGKETINDGSIECRTLTEKKYPVGLIQLNEVLISSIDGNCKNAETPSCSNYNYLSRISSNFWTLTGFSGNTYEIFYVFPARYNKAYNTKRVNMAIYLSNRLTYVSGSGTSEDPYVIQ